MTTPTPEYYGPGVCERCNRDVDERVLDSYYVGSDTFQDVVVCEKCEGRSWPDEMAW